MLSKLLCDPVTKEKFYPRFKFNGGHIAIVCHKCGKIIKENISLSDIKRKIENLYCANCATELIMEILKKL